MMSLLVWIYPELIFAKWLRCGVKNLFRSRRILLRRLYKAFKRQIETFAHPHKTGHFVIPANPGSGPVRTPESGIFKSFLDSGSSPE
jgi:hypothetical protein